MCQKQIFFTLTRRQQLTNDNRLRRVRRGVSQWRGKITNHLFWNGKRRMRLKWARPISANCHRLHLFMACCGMQSSAAIRPLYDCKMYRNLQESWFHSVGCAGGGGGIKCAIAGPEPLVASGQGIRPQGCTVGIHPPSRVLLYTKICTLLKDPSAPSWRVSHWLVGGGGVLSACCGLLIHVSSTFLLRFCCASTHRLWILFCILSVTLIFTSRLHLFFPHFWPLKPCPPPPPLCHLTHGAPLWSRPRVPVCRARPASVCRSTCRSVGSGQGTSTSSNLTY